MKFRLVVLFILISWPVLAIPNVRNEYRVNLLNTKSHTVHVSLHVRGYTAKTATFQMPVWAPGAYSVTHYGKYIQNFKAFDKNHDTLSVIRVNDDRWEIANGRAVKEIEYDVLDSHSDTTSLYFAMAHIDTGIFFANATALFGYFDDDKKADYYIIYEYNPKEWNLACSLDPVFKYKPGIFTNVEFYAKNYDALADAPILAAPISAGPHENHILTSTFKDGLADYDVAVVTDGIFSEQKMDSLTLYLKRIVHAETDFFHDTPFKHYTFEIVSPTLSHMPSFAQGALEHANASDYLLADFSWSLFKGNFLSIFSHEFFHLWNVKRIHSNLLGPFDYTKRVMTTSLWMAEGITEYYAHTLLARYGIETPEHFYSDIQQWRNEMQQSPPVAGMKSLEALSIDESDFHIDEATLFYSRGPLVALMLDIEIRERTNNKHSLDDVMLALNRDAKQGKTFREEDLIKKVEHYAGCDLTDFYDHYIHGTDSLPIDAYLTKMGFSRPSEAESETHQAQTSISPYHDSLWRIDVLDSTSPLIGAGVQPGDVLHSVNGARISQDNLMSVFVNSDTIHLGIERNGVPMQVTVEPPSESTSTSPLKSDSNRSSTNIDPNASPVASAIRKGIVGE